MKRTAVYICGPGADWDDSRGVADDQPIEVLDCPREAEHNYGPSGYNDWHEWAKNRNRTHKNSRCACDRYLIWTPRKPAAKKGST